jgi:D-lactate dehydrogenase (cytochrome)
MMQAINHSGLSAKTFPEVDSLFFKFQGSSSSINETSKLIKTIVNNHGCTRFQAARSTEEADELWNHRKIALWSTLAWPDDADARVWTTDVCVPPSKLPQLVKETKEDMEESKLLSTIVGHVGDGKC